MHQYAKRFESHNVSLVARHEYKNYLSMYWYSYNIDKRRYFKPGYIFYGKFYTEKAVSLKWHAPCNTYCKFYASFIICDPGSISMIWQILGANLSNKTKLSCSAW